MQIAAVLATAAICAVLSPATPAGAAPTHVALVVDGQGSYCVAWHAGMSGADVLHDAGAAVKIDPNQGGLIIGIGIGIGDVIESDSRVAYWAYFQDSGSGWGYSNFGAAGTKPKPGSIEGWRVNQTSGGHLPPAASTYAAICGGQDAPPPAPTTAAPTKAANTSKAVAVSPPTVGPATTGATAGATGSVDASTTTDPTGSSTGATPSSPSASGVTTVNAPVPSASVSLAASSATSDGGSPAAVIVGGLLIVMLAAGGGLTAWRRNRTRGS